MLARLGAIPERVKKASVLSHVFDQTRAALERDPGILTTSVYNTTLQWDWPNGWPPLQYIAMKAMLNVQALLPADMRSADLVYTLAARNAASAFCSWYKTGGSIPDVLPKTQGVQDSGHMFEKFDVRYMGQAGFGGECKSLSFTNTSE